MFCRGAAPAAWKLAEHDLQRRPEPALHNRSQRRERQRPLAALDFGDVLAATESGPLGYFVLGETFRLTQPTKAFAEAFELGVRR